MLAQRHAASAAGARAPLARNATTRRATTRRGALVVRAQEISVSVDKPLGLTLKERGDGRPGVQIAQCKGNASKAGLKAGGHRQVPLVVFRRRAVAGGRAGVLAKRDLGVPEHG